MQQVLTFILGGGRGTRLYPLTKNRSEPAVPIAGKYRLIDIPISNCINSGLMKIHVLTQYSSVSLHRHIGNTYKFSPFSQGFVSVLAAQQTNEAADWYQGTADAIRQNIRYVIEENCEDVLILSGDQFYRFDFGELVRSHRDSNAAVTMAVLPVAEDRARDLGVVRIDDSRRIIDLVEKPRQTDQLATLRYSEPQLRQFGYAKSDRPYLANMGIYLFKRDALIQLLEQHPSAVDMVTGVLTPALDRCRVQAYLFRGYWEDVGSIAAYHRANLALACAELPIDFSSADAVVYTRMRDLPASRVSAATLDHCYLSDGCIVEAGAVLQRCVIGVRSFISRNVRMKEVVMLGANSYDDRSRQSTELPPVGIGEGSVLERCIVDKNCRIGKGVRIVNATGVREADGPNYVIRDGIVVLPNRAVVADGTVI